MKNFKFFAVFITIFAFISLSAAEKNVDLQTNLHCGACKAKIEKTMKKVTGVKSTVANVESKVVSIKYDSDKISEAKIINYIKDLGYTADVIKNNTNNVDKKDNCETDKPKSTRKTKESCCGKDAKK